MHDAAILTGGKVPEIDSEPDGGAVDSPTPRCAAILAGRSCARWADHAGQHWTAEPSVIHWNDATNDAAVAARRAAQ